MSHLLRTAVELQEAIDKASLYLPRLGYCSSMAIYLEKSRFSEFDWYEEESYAQTTVAGKAMKELNSLQSKHKLTFASGKLELVCKIIISRAGCEYKGNILSEGCVFLEDKDLDERLRKWYEGGAVADGDMKVEEAEVVPPVVDSEAGTPLAGDGDGEESEVVAPVVGSAGEIPATLAGVVDMKGEESEAVPPVVGSGVGILVADDDDVKGKESKVVPPVVGSGVGIPMTDDGDMKGKESKVVPPVVGSGVGIPMTDDGDMKGKESEIIPPVVGSTAREIPATEFSVSSNLITKVEELWSESFHQKHVRAEPYKIHLYGPGAPLHKADNGPETDFVGRFFVGLGERIYDGRYSIPLLKVKKVGGWDKNHAYPGWWVAFYADVDYSIPEIKRGYAAVIEFKIFQQHLEVPEESADVVLRGKLENVLMKLPVPYGILLHHHYPGGTEDLFGLDALMYAAAGATGDAKLLPVQIRWTNSRWGDGKANVYPMTDDHLETILTHLETRTLEQACAEDFYEHRRSMGTKPELFVDLKGTEAEWIHHHQSPQPIPFYSPDFPATAIPWKLSEVYDTDTSGARGHRPCNEESIYLSYAVVVVPKRGVKRAAEEEEPSAE